MQIEEMMKEKKMLWCFTDRTQCKYNEEAQLLEISPLFSY